MRASELDHSYNSTPVKRWINKQSYTFRFRMILSTRAKTVRRRSISQNVPPPPALQACYHVSLYESIELNHCFIEYILARFAYYNANKCCPQQSQVPEDSGVNHSR